MLEILLEREALFHRDGADVDLERLKLPTPDGLDGFERQIVNFRALVERRINLIAVFAGEAGAVDVDGNAAELAFADAEALEVADRCIQHGVHRLETVRALHGVHIPVIGDDLCVDIGLALVLLDPRQQTRAIEVGDPVQAVRHVHDDHVVDDFTIFVQRSGVFRAPDRDLGNVADINFLQDLQCVLAGDLHQIMRPAVEAHASTDGLGIGARNFVFLKQHIQAPPYSIRRSSLRMTLMSISSSSRSSMTQDHSGLTSVFAAPFHCAS